MGSGIFESTSRVQTPVKHRVFVSYHHHADQHYYDAFYQAFHQTHEVIYDTSLERRVDSDDVNYVIRRIRENYITGSSCTIVLVGAESSGRKYIDWEIAATLDKHHGLIGVYLPTAARNPTNQNVIVPDRLFDNIRSGFALWLSWETLVTSSAQLERYVADAKTRSLMMIDNSRVRRLRNG